MMSMAPVSSSPSPSPDMMAPVQPSPVMMPPSQAHVQTSPVMMNRRSYAPAIMHPPSPPVPSMVQTPSPPVPSMVPSSMDTSNEIEGMNISHKFQYFSCL